MKNTSDVSDRSVLSPRHDPPDRPFVPVGKSLTKQSLGVGLETAEIVEKFYRTGDVSAWNQRYGSFGEWSGPTELHDALNRVLAAQEAFDALPAQVRDHVQNDPVAFLELVHDPSRVEELRGLGLVPPGEVTPPLRGVEDKAEPSSDGDK